MTIYAYDIESFKNLFTATFVNVEDEKEKHVFYIGLGKTDYSDIKTFLNQEMVLVGFNNHSYDDPMLRFLMSYAKDNFPIEAYNLTAKLINDDFRSDKKILSLRYPRDVLYPWKSIDLMKILAFDKMGISLKQTAVNLRWHRIQDLPFEPSDTIDAKDLAMVLDYNLNDVLITKKLYEEITPIRELRTDLSKIYNVDMSSASDSKMANLILENIYSNELKMDIRALRVMRTPRERVLLGECIAKFVKFESPVLIEMLKDISLTHVYNYNKYSYRKRVYFANCTFSLGVGGLHTEDAPGKFETTDDYVIQDMDVASYYPNLIINGNLYPDHLGPQFIEVLKNITAERLQAKKDGDKVKAEGLKITINSIFGKLGSQYFWLYDPKKFLSTTISGQMGLMMLVEGMHMNGIEVISCNTDGVVCRIPRERMDEYYRVAHAWEKATGLELEFTVYKKYVRRDVNSYITEKEDGDTKEKGVFVKKIDFTRTSGIAKSYHMPIVAKALHEYFIKGIPVKKTLEDCKDIMDFCISQKSGAVFKIELHTGKTIEKLQKTNRFFITTKGGALLKRSSISNKLIGLYVGNQVRILNEYDDTVPFEDYNVDLAFYEKEVMKVIDEIEPKQMMLFSLKLEESGKKTKFEIPARKEEYEKDKNINSNDLNRLGKNQLKKRIESVSLNNEKINGVDPRYVYIDAFNPKSMTAIVYCLAKGVRTPIIIDKQAYRKNKLENGEIIYCTKFGKKDGMSCVLEYKIAEKLEEITEKLL